jgi:hypothetical protein
MDGVGCLKKLAGTGRLGVAVLKKLVDSGLLGARPDRATPAIRKRADIVRRREARHDGLLAVLWSQRTCVMRYLENRPKFQMWRVETMI